MKIETVRFLKGIRGTDPIATDGTRQYIFVGRSNVGKSSVINALAGRKDLARSSATPGKTQEINYYLVNENSETPSLYLVDLPGYGYARVRDKDKEQLVKMILWYLMESGANIERVFLLIDAVVGPTEKDREMIRALTDAGLPFSVVANKFDKINKSVRQRRVKELAQETGVPVVPFSAEKREGVEEVLTLIG